MARRRGDAEEDAERAKKAEKEWEDWLRAEDRRLQPNLADVELSDAIILRLHRRVDELTAQIEWLESVKDAADD
jgi:hypothetical protein